MQATICKSDDEAAVVRLREVLSSMGAEVAEEGWSLGLDVSCLKIDTDEVMIQSDGWTVEIEGPRELVSKITTAVAVGS